jgi:hypothetical protein
VIRRVKVDVYADILQLVAGDILRRGHEIFEASGPDQGRHGDHRLP